MTLKFTSNSIHIVCRIMSKERQKNCMCNYTWENHYPHTNAYTSSDIGRERERMRKNDSIKTVKSKVEPFSKNENVFIWKGARAWHNIDRRRNFNFVKWRMCSIHTITLTHNNNNSYAAHTCTTYVDEKSKSTVYARASMIWRAKEKREKNRSSYTYSNENRIVNRLA